MSQAEARGADDPASDIGIVIVSYNTRDLLDACLKSLALALGDDGRQTGSGGSESSGGESSNSESSGSESSGSESSVGAAYSAPGGENKLRRSEVWVVDNASSDGSADHVAARFPWVHVESFDRNLGFTAANNIVLKRWLDAPEGPPTHVLLLNPDTEITRQSLDILGDALDADPTVGMVGPALVYPDGRFQHAAFRFPGLVQTVLDLWPIERLTDRPINGRYPESRYAAGIPFDVDFVLGACMLLRGTAVQSIGPLDEGFFMYCEEIDWCVRLRDRGWRIACVPAAKVVHHAGASTSQFRSLCFIHLWRSRKRLARKHGSAWRRLLFDAVLSAGLFTRSIADRLDVMRGRMEAAERNERLEAYRAIRQGESET